MENFGRESVAKSGTGRLGGVLGAEAPREGVAEDAQAAVARGGLPPTKQLAMNGRRLAPTGVRGGGHCAPPNIKCNGGGKNRPHRN
jgi:hypothetical protein